MSFLTLFHKDQFKGKYSIAEGETLTIGRREDNDVVIDSLTVSGGHAKLDGLEQGYLLTDLRSKNGSYVNGVRAASHWLADGDVIELGDHSLKFTLEDDDAFSFAGGSMDQTMIYKTGSQEFADGMSVMRKRQAAMAGMGANVPGEDGQWAALLFMQGGEGETRLTKKIVSIGKDPANDIVIPGLLVGKTAATISKRPDGYYLSYAGGLTKPRVNGKKVNMSERLVDLDVIEIGSVKLRFGVREHP